MNEEKLLLLIDNLARRCSTLESLNRDMALQIQQTYAALEAHQSALEHLAGMPETRTAAQGVNYA